MTALRLLVYTITLPVVVVFVRRLYQLSVNYRVARQLNIPIVLLPISWHDDAWLLCWKWFAWLRPLPFVKPWFDFSRFSWTQDLRFRPHIKFGDAFVLVAPGGVEIMINDPQAVIDLHTKYRYWLKPEPVFALFDTFGKNVVSVNGDDWQRHRRIINPAFQEPNHKLVWEEGRRQAQHMLKSWVENGGTSTVEGISKDCVVLALHVLSRAGFGQAQDFKGGVREVPSGHVKSFSETLSFLLGQSISVLMFHNVTLPDSILPQHVRIVKQSVADFKLYMREAISYARGLIQGGGATEAPEITTTLIKANEAAKREHKAAGAQAGAKPIYLSDDEVLGNLYIFNIAGFETTANALTYAIPYLAAHSEVQEWLMEEIDQAYGTSDGGGMPSYESTFPNLTRCVAVLYETLRLWAPVTDSPRWAAGESQNLTIGGQEIVVPQGVYVSTNNYGVHSDPRWWGNDSLEWKPKRWITIDANKKETIAPPPPGAAFVAWACGPRSCPGKKFSQVEFSAVLSLLLSKYRLAPLVMAHKGMKTEADGRKALLDAIWSSHNMLTPKIGGGKEAGVALVKR